MNTQGIFLSWIVVKDIKAALKFYTEVVGLNLREYHEQFGWAELSGADGTVLGIAQQSPSEAITAGSNAVVTITVKDVQQARKDFQKKNVTLVGDIIEIPGHVKMQTFRDQDGNTFQLCEMFGDNAANKK